MRKIINLAFVIGSSCYVKFYSLPDPDYTSVNTEVFSSLSKV